MFKFHLDIFLFLSSIIHFSQMLFIQSECSDCAYYKCPENISKCLLGAVLDSCYCCPEGRCANYDGQTCWNATLNLPITAKNKGFCATNYRCQLREDLHEEDQPEAICVCMEQTPACGSNDKTYSTPCKLHEEALKLKNTSLKLKHLGPCLSRPWFVSPLSNISIAEDHRVDLSCETKGFPVPDIFWEFHSPVDGRVIKLPSEGHDIFIQTNETEPLVKTSWLLINKLTHYSQGIYYCIANNSIGESLSSAFVSIS